MAVEHLEVRLDRERRRRLREVAAARGKPVSEIVRLMIDQAYEDILREERARAARELAALSIENVPEPGELKHQLEGTYDLPDLR